MGAGGPGGVRLPCPNAQGRMKNAEAVAMGTTRFAFLATWMDLRPRAPASWSLAQVSEVRSKESRIQPNSAALGPEVAHSPRSKVQTAPQQARLNGIRS